MRYKSEARFLLDTPQYLKDQHVTFLGAGGFPVLKPCVDCGCLFIPNEQSAWVEAAGSSYSSSISICACLLCEAAGSCFCSCTLTHFELCLSRSGKE